MANHSNTSTTGTNTITIAAANGKVHNLTYLSVSQATPGIGQHGKVTVYDGSITGTVIFSVHVPAPRS